MESLTPGPTHDRQGELIEQYCSEARDLLYRARSKEEAMEVKKRVCLQLAEECDSLLVLDATETYIEDVIRRKWRGSVQGADPPHDARGFEE